MSDIDKIISRLNGAIVDSGYSYAELEKKTGISKSALQRYATGKTKKIPLDVIDDLAPILNVSPAFLMGWENDNTLGDYEENIEYLKDEPRLLELYKNMVENNNYAILFDKVQKLKPNELEQILRIIDTFIDETK